MLPTRRQASAETKEGPIQPISVDLNCPEVVVQGLIRKRSDHWCVTLFLAGLWRGICGFVVLIPLYRSGKGAG